MRKDSETSSLPRISRNGGASPKAAGLATPTDLSVSERSSVTAALNTLVADALAIYIKTKNFHWHLSGPRFRDYHLLFDEQAHDILESVDVLAERVRKIGGTTIKSISQIVELQTIKDDNDPFVEADSMIERLLADNRAMASGIRRAIETCEDNRDSPSGNILQELLDQTEQRVWFLFEISRHSRPAV